jgi:hypothetical protein
LWVAYRSSDGGGMAPELPLVATNAIRVIE